MSATAKFDGRGDDYARYRPTWPIALIQSTLNGLTHPVVADVGAGTGISARVLKACGARVICVEPNASMRELLDASLERCEGTAEATNLPARSVDVIATFQAYHWFDGAAFLREAARIGRRPYRVVAAWYDRDRMLAFGRAYEHAIARHGEAVTTRDRLRRMADVEGDFRAAGLAVQTSEATYDQPLTWESLVGFMRSCSYLPASGEAYGRLVDEVRPIFDRADREGNAFFRWRFVAYIGTPP